MSEVKHIRTAAGLLVLLSAAAFGQNAAPPPAFEVASIKPAPPPSGGGIRIMLGGDAGRIDYSNVSLRDVMREAYQVKDFQINGPDWLNSVRFDITAKIPPGTSTDQRRLMLQTLLADRFQLKLHRETKELPVFALVVAKNGPKLKESEKKEGVPNGRMRMQPGHLEGIGFSMQQFTDMLGRQVGQPVLDMTELKGNYDFTLTFTPDENQQRAMAAAFGGPAGGPPGAGERHPAPEIAEGASIFSALQEQLGLRLEKRKGPVEILVIDHVERVPTDN